MQGGYWGLDCSIGFLDSCRVDIGVLDCSIGFLGSPPNPLKEAKWILGLIGVVWGIVNFHCPFNYCFHY